MLTKSPLPSKNREVSDTYSRTKYKDAFAYSPGSSCLSTQTRVQLLERDLLLTDSASLPLLAAVSLLYSSAASLATRHI